MKKDTPRRTVKVKLKEGQKDQTDIARSNRSRSLERSATAPKSKAFVLRLAKILFCREIFSNHEWTRMNANQIQLFASISVYSWFFPSLCLRLLTACPLKLFLFRLISTYLSEGGSIRGYPILGAFGNNPGER